MRVAILALLGLVTAACSSSSCAQEKIGRSSELQVLDRFVGTWDMKVTATTPGQKPVTLGAISVRKWSRGGKFIVFDDPQGDEVHMSITHDPNSETYPGVMMAGLSRGLVTATWDDESKAMNFEVKHTDGTVYKGKHHFIRDDYAEASGSVTSSNGEVLLELSYKQTLRKKKK